MLRVVMDSPRPFSLTTPYGSLDVLSHIAGVEPHGRSAGSPRQMGASTRSTPRNVPAQDTGSPPYARTPRLGRFSAVFNHRTGERDLQAKNLAARAGRWSATHRKTAVIGWIMFVVLATLIGGKVGQRTLEESASGNGDSKRGAMIVDDAGFPQQVGERVLIQGKGSIRSDDPRVTAAAADVVSRLSRIKGVTDVESPLRAEDRANTVSKDGRSVLVTFAMPAETKTKADLKKLETLADAPLAAVAAVQKAHPELRVEEHGDASQQKALGPQDRADEAKEMQFSLGGTLIILLILLVLLLLK